MSAPEDPDALRSPAESQGVRIRRVEVREHDKLAWLDLTIIALGFGFEFALRLKIRFVLIGVDIYVDESYLKSVKSYSSLNVSLSRSG